MNNNCDLENYCTFVGGKVTIKRDIESIPDELFANNQDIVEVIIPGTIKDIRNRVFSNCVNLRKVSFEKNTVGTRMNNGSGIFEKCPNLEEVHFSDFDTFNHYSYDSFGPLENGSYLYIGEKQIDKFVIPNSVNSEQWKNSCLRNLAGGKVKDIRFEDGSKIVGYKLKIRTEDTFGDEYGITKHEFVRDIENTFLDKNSNFKFIEIDDIHDYLNNRLAFPAYRCDRIISDFNTLKERVEYSKNSIIK